MPCGFTLYLPVPPDRANARKHWGTLRREESEWATRALVDMQNSHLRPDTPLERFTIHIVMYTKKMMDADNAKARCKKLLDVLCGSPKAVKGHGIVYRTPRWLAGDSPDHVVGLTVVPAVNFKWPHVEVHVCEVTAVNPIP